MNVSESSDEAPRPLTFTLLRLLSDGKFHSGQVLATQLRLSRTSVNNALQGVERYGLALHSVRGRGYRLVNPPQWLNAPAIKHGLGQAARFFTINILDSASSSNTLLMRQARQGAPGGSVLAVEWQSAGRGRIGRAWHSALGDALTFSLLWRFEGGLTSLSGLSLVVGLALLRALRKLGIDDIGLKWPNDVLTSQGKLAGILIEAHGDMLGPCVVVIGIGLNLQVSPELAGRIDQPASGLAQVCNELPERNALLAALLTELADALPVFAEQGFKAMLAEWEKNHVYHGKQVTLVAPDGSQVTGVVRGVNEGGELCLMTAQGERVVSIGELRLRGE